MSGAETFASTNQSEIAIIGLACRFPGAKNPDEFWRNLRDGVESISFFSDQELESSGVTPALLSDPNYVKAAALLEDARLFDASFFGFNPREAEITDPQHRLFLECVWQALESAGYDAETYKGAVGVYAGAGMNAYFLSHLHPNDEIKESVGDNQIRMGNRIDNLCTRVSYKLNLRGPSLLVQTNCSTSLVAVHLACQSLLIGESDMALAGGVRVGTSQKAGYLYQQGGIVSPDGHCRAFDARAQGMIGGDGAGVVLLKRLGEALADGDSIHAVIKSSAVNNDGSAKIGYTAPGSDGQRRVIAEALAMGGVEPETITYVEAHGTGTDLGDPIEIAALTQAFRAGTEKKGFCAVGSVKTNIGHTDTAAGVAGLIKTVLALKHQQLPPSLHFERPNPKIDFANSPFYVNARLAEWSAAGGQTPRRAGVSSFGIGGTNAHVILEEAPVRRESLVKSRPSHLLVLSAKSGSALETMTANLACHLQPSPGLNLTDVAYTLGVGRGNFSHRRMLVCDGLGDAVTALETSDPQRVFTAHQEAKDRPVVFMFPGQGAQYVQMASELYRVEAAFRHWVDTCAEILQPHLDHRDLRHQLFPNEEQAASAAPQLKQTSIAQPALFVIEYALARLWMEWGLRPEAMIGHSIGEYVAACLAGVFSLEDALALVAARGRLMQQLPGGAMLAVPLPAGEVQGLLKQKKNLSLAAINGPSLCVVSGPEDAIDAWQTQLAEQGVDGRRLHTSHAFHSAMMDSILEPFTEQVERLTLKSPQIPYISNLTGTWIKAAEATAPSYWAKHLRQTVRFADGIEELLKEPSRVFLEIGPGQTLGTLAKRHPERTVEQVVLSSLPHAHDRHSDVGFLLNTLGRLWLAGARVDWPAFYAGQSARRVPLPTYPFERQRYWIEPPGPAGGNTRRPQPLTKKAEIADWFYLPLWKQTPPLAPSRHFTTAREKPCWLIFTDACGIGSRLARQLEEAGQDVTSVSAGEQFDRRGERRYQINPREPADYQALLEELCAGGKRPQLILHLWGVTADDDLRRVRESLEDAQHLGFYSLLFLAQACGAQKMTERVRIGVVTNGVQEVTGEEKLSPAKATVLGPCRVIPQEYPHIACRSVDVVLPPPGSRHEEKLINLLITELAGEPSGSTVAYRGDHRWEQTFEAVRLDGAAAGTPLLKAGGVYLITGGLGGIGLELAEHLARTIGAKLILTGRSPFPPREEWDRWLAGHTDEDVVSRKIRKLRALEELGAEVLVARADAADVEEMRAVVSRARARFGEIRGVIHAAGIAGGGMIQLKAPEVAASVLAPKVEGTIVLDAIFKDAKLDLLVLCAARTGIVGGVGQADYTAANAFLDAFARDNTKRQPETYTVAIDWGTWQEVGMAVNTEMPLGIEEWRRRNLKTGMLPQEGVEAFRRILSSTLPQVIVSTEDFQARIEQADEITASSLVADIAKTEPPNPTHSRPDIASAYVAPRNEVEQVVAEIWQQLFGLEQVGIHDDFFELGGHSLLGLQVISRLRSSFRVELPLLALFESPSVAGLAASVARRLAEKAEPEEMIRMLAELEELSDEEAQRLLVVPVQPNGY